MAWTDRVESYIAASEWSCLECAGVEDLVNTAD
jgi:hypothetical protein